MSKARTFVMLGVLSLGAILMSGCGILPGLGGGCCNSCDPCSAPAPTCGGCNTGCCN